MKGVRLCRKAWTYEGRSGWTDEEAKPCPGADATPLAGRAIRLVGGARWGSLTAEPATFVLRATTDASGEAVFAKAFDEARRVAAFCSSRDTEASFVEAADVTDPESASVDEPPPPERAATTVFVARPAKWSYPAADVASYDGLSAHALAAAKRCHAWSVESCVTDELVGCEETCGRERGILECVFGIHRCYAVHRDAAVRSAKCDIDYRECVVRANVSPEDQGACASKCANAACQ